MGRSCPLTTVISMTFRVMETGWLRFCLLRIFLALFKWKTASVVFGTTASVLYLPRVWHRAPTARFLVSASAVASLVTWPGSVRRLGAPLFLFLVLLHGSSDESDHAMEQSSPSPSIVASVPVSAQSTHSSVPHESGHVMEELPRSCPRPLQFLFLSLFLLICYRVWLPLQLPCPLLLLTFLSCYRARRSPLPHLLLLQTASSNG